MRGPPIDRSLAGRSALVTGSTTGLGLEVARDLAAAGARVIVVARAEARGEAAKAELLRTHPDAQVEVLVADLSSLAETRRLAEDADARFGDLAILVNNAAVWPTERVLTPEGIELSWATNVLAYHLLVDRLASRLAENAPARVVNVASRLAHGLDLDDPELARRFDAQLAYARSKQANRMMSWHFAKVLGPRGVTVNAVHPGTVDTQLFRSHGGLYGWIGRAYFRWLGRTPKAGADSVSYLAGHSAVEGKTGEFWADRRTRRCPYRDPAEVSRLAAICERRIREVLGR